MDPSAIDYSALCGDSTAADSQPWNAVRFVVPVVVCVVATTMLWFVGDEKAAIIGIAFTCVLFVAMAVGLGLGFVSRHRSQQQLKQVGGFAAQNGFTFDAVAQRLSWSHDGIAFAAGALDSSGRRRLIAGPLELDAEQALALLSDKSVQSASLDPTYSATLAIVGDLLVASVRYGPINDRQLWRRLLTLAAAVDSARNGLLGLDH